MGFTAQIRNDSGDYVPVATQSELIQHIKSDRIVSLWGSRAELEDAIAVLRSRNVRVTQIQYSRNGNTYVRINGSITFDLDDFKKGL